MVKSIFSILKSLFFRFHRLAPWHVWGFEAVRQVRPGWSRHGAERVLRGGDDGPDLRTEARIRREVQMKIEEMDGYGCYISTYTLYLQSWYKVGPPGYKSVYKAHKV